MSDYDLQAGQECTVWNERIGERFLLSLSLQDSCEIGRFRFSGDKQGTVSSGC